ncbi:MAG TPA: polysaccharide deacetylase family protein [Calditerricola sp.]
MRTRRERRDRRDAGRFAVVLLVAFCVLWALASRGPIDRYGAALAPAEPKEPVDEEWMAKVRQLAAARRVPPVDARLDPVWKAIPGYNGLEVDVEQSYWKSRAMGVVSAEALVYRQVPPKVQLDDLMPAPIYKGNPQKPVVALMVNVSWGTEWIEPMLDILRREGVRATFFLDGSWVAKNPDVAKQIAAAGHEIGNHGYSHPLFSRVSTARIEQEIARTNEVIERTVGVRPSLLAPPAGDYDERTVRLAWQAFGMKTILWTLDTVDWKRPPATAIVQRIVPRVHGGALILMHPTEPTVKALPALIRGIRAKELIPSTVSDCLSPERVTGPFPPTENQGSSGVGF